MNCRALGGVCLPISIAMLCIGVLSSASAIDVPKPPVPQTRGVNVHLARSKAVMPNISAVAWSPDGELIATAHNAHLDVTVWDARSLETIKVLNQGSKGFGRRNVAFSPDGRYLVSGLTSVNVWRVGSWEQRARLVAPHLDLNTPQFAGIQSLAFSPDGGLLVVAYGGAQSVVVAYEMPSGTIRWTHEPERKLGTPGVTTEVIFSRDGRRVIFGTGEPARNADGFPIRQAKLAFLETLTGRLEASRDGIHVDDATALAGSPDGRWIATGTSTGTTRTTADVNGKGARKFQNNDPVRIWDATTNKLLKELPVQTRPWAFAITRDSRYLIASRVDRRDRISLSLVVWNVNSGALVQEFESWPASLALALSPDGTELAGAAGNMLFVYGLNTSQ